MCQSCGSLLFQENKLSEEQIGKNKSFEDFSFLFDLGFKIVLFLVLFIFGSRIIYNISVKYPFFHLVLFVAVIIFSFFYFLIYFMTHKVNEFFYNCLLFIYYIELILTTFSNHYHNSSNSITYACIMSFVLTIASYFYVKNKFLKKELINILFSGIIIGILIITIKDVIHHIFTVHQVANKYSNFYILLSTILNLFLVFFIIKFMLKKNNSNIVKYIVLFNSLFIIRLLIIYYLIYIKTWTYTIGYISEIAFYLLYNILLNAIIFYIINKSRKIIKLKKFEVVTVSIYFLFSLLLRNYDNLPFKNFFTYFTIFGIVSSILSTLICHLIIALIFKKKNSA